MNAAQSEIFDKAVNYITASLPRRKPLLYGPDNKPLLPTSSYSISRSASKRAGSMKNWIPRRLLVRGQEALERERIVERSVDLSNNDPHASGVVDNFATTVIGSGLVPHPTLDPDTLALSKEQIRLIQKQQKRIYQSWFPFADAGCRMNFGEIQFLCMRNIITFGEYIVLAHMIDDETRPYYLACQVIHPLRLKTPVDKLNDPNIRDGVELGEYGEPVAYWIKKTDPRAIGNLLPDISTNFIRIPAKKAHRWNVFHDFIVQEPEQVRGIPFFAPAMKFFRDLNDYLDAELVSNIVTAAFSLFIETSDTDPLSEAINQSTFDFPKPDTSGSEKKERYKELVPGLIMYGLQGQKPHTISANRPGATFEPFTVIIKKAISMALNIPYAVLFKDVEKTNFAGFRSAMLDAWRVFMHRRTWLGQELCQKVYTMLMEEAWLRGELEIDEFYSNMHAITNAEWQGSPKGDIEPVKETTADLLAIKGKIKTRARAIAERGGELRSTFDQLQEEEEMMRDRGLTDEDPDLSGIGKGNEENDEGEGQTQEEELE